MAALIKPGHHKLTPSKSIMYWNTIHPGTWMTSSNLSVESVHPFIRSFIVPHMCYVHCPYIELPSGSAGWLSCFRPKRWLAVSDCLQYNSQNAECFFLLWSRNHSRCFMLFCFKYITADWRFCEIDFVICATSNDENGTITVSCFHCYGLHLLELFQSLRSICQWDNGASVCLPNFSRNILARDM